MFLQLTRSFIGRTSLNIEAIKAAQQEDEDLRKWKNNNPNCYFTTKIGKVKNVLCYCKPGLNKEENWKIVLPRKLLMSTIKWFHIVTGHPGENRLELTLRSRFFHPELRHLVKKFKCDLCQRHNLPGKGMYYYLKQM